MTIELLRGALGLVAFPFLAWLLSTNRGVVMWKTVVFGLLIQLSLGTLVMLTQPGQAFFLMMNDVVVNLLDLSNEGAKFLFGRLVDSQLEVLADSQYNRGATFAFSVLPTIIFFSSLMSVIYYTGVMQKIVEFIAWLMMKLLGTSGAETLSVSSNMFVGQTEAPLVVKPFIQSMTRSELSTVMTGGFATVAGGVMAAYVGMLQGSFPGIAGHLLTASIMSAPAAIVMSKLAFPETGEPATGGDVKIDVETEDSNVIDAAAQGAKTGLRLAANVGAMLLAFIALVHLANTIVSWGGNQVHTLLTEHRGQDAFLWGLIFGGGLSFFVLARMSWRRHRTKFWIGGVLTVILVTSLTYLVLAGTTTSVLTAWGTVALITGLLASFSVIGVFGRSVIGRDFSLLLFFTSLTKLIAVSIGFGIVTLLVGGSSSLFGASLICGVVLAVVPGLIVFWPDPSSDGLLRATLWFVGSAAVITVAISATQLGTSSVDLLELLRVLSLEKLFGYVFSALAFLMGVPMGDLVNFGELIGHKIVVNEFVAFLKFQTMAESGVLDPRTMVIASYALCGFANFSSIAIQIGGIGGLAPDRESDLAEIGPRAMVCGALASFQTAAVAGIMQTLAGQLGIDLVRLTGG